MNEYIRIEFQNISNEQSEILMALLSEQGFEGYEESDMGLKAYIKEKDFDKYLFLESISPFQINFSETIIQETNWNEVWESNFDPVIVDDFVAVRAHFHKPVKNVQFEIIITPKMSFGTGHHATTYMMMQNMKEIDFKNKTVFDFGTGTGVLAILAEKMGAKNIIATDNDKWSIENAQDNIERNGCTAIKLLLSDSADLNSQFDIILANINRNIILDNLPALAKLLVANGTLFFSGLMAEDELTVVTESAKYQLLVENKVISHNWLFLRLSKK